MLDPGAVEAIVDHGASLLAVGMTGVEGSFTAGDPVDIVDPEGTVVARGLVGFSSDELPAMVGLSSTELAERLGEPYDRVVVHRDVLVPVHR